MKRASECLGRESRSKQGSVVPVFEPPYYLETSDSQSQLTVQLDGVKKTGISLNVNGTSFKLHARTYINAVHLGKYKMIGLKQCSFPTTAFNRPTAFFRLELLMDILVDPREIKVKSVGKHFLRFSFPSHVTEIPQRPTVKRSAWKAKFKYFRNLFLAIVGFQSLHSSTSLSASSSNELLSAPSSSLSSSSSSFHLW